MALRRRGQKWYADYYANGARVIECTGTANRREAEKFVALRISEVQRGVFVKPVNTTLAELGERFSNTPSCTSGRGSATYRC